MTLSPVRNRALGSREELERLLALVVADELDDAALLGVRERAVEVTEHLAGHGLVPAHLTVQPDDPPVVVVRTLAAVLHRVSGAPAELR